MTLAQLAQLNTPIDFNGFGSIVLAVAVFLVILGLLSKKK